MARTLMGKTRDKGTPYATFRGGGWEWRVLKGYSADDSKPYSRWFCAVSSPFTYGSHDLGDTYVSEVISNGVLVQVDETVPGLLEHFVDLKGIRIGNEVYEAHRAAQTPKPFTVGAALGHKASRAARAITGTPDLEAAEALGLAVEEMEGLL